jgi:hypothetical protein
MDRRMKIQQPPDSCPRCGGSRLVRILWGYSDLTDEDAKSVARGQASLGLNRRYFPRNEGSLVAGAIGIRQPHLPTWACLDCAPGWVELHQLAVSEWEIETAKFAAVEALEFEKAAALLHDQERLEHAHTADFNRLLRGLIEEGAIENTYRWSQESLARHLGLPSPDPFSQDWEYEVADSSKVGEWLNAYNSGEFDPCQLTMLMEMILASYEDAMREGSARPEDRDTIRRCLLQGRKLHEATVDYWALPDEPDLENGFAITPLMRDIRETMRQEKWVGGGP